MVVAPIHIWIYTTAFSVAKESQKSIHIYYKNIHLRDFMQLDFMEV